MPFNLTSKRHSTILRRYKDVLILCVFPQQNYSGHGGGSGNGGGGGDEDYEIPPITPPNHPEPHLLHLMDPESSYLCHSIPHNGLINPYSYSELPALMMSNMLAQDGHLLSSQMPSVSPGAIPQCTAVRSRPTQTTGIMGSLPTQRLLQTNYLDL